MEFSHINPQGRARMVDIGAKGDTERWALAQAVIEMQPPTLEAIIQGKVAKGDVLAAAQVAGIMAAKQTPFIIPMCHPLLLTGVDIHFAFDESRSCIVIQALVKTTGKTGVEMEALTAAGVAALTVYDMTKAVDPWMEIKEIKLIEKAGGKSGFMVRKDSQKPGFAALGVLHSICISPEREQLKKEVQEARIIENHGIEFDGHAGPWERQVTCLNLASVHRINREHHLQAGPGDFAENLLISGVDFSLITPGDSLKIGEDVVLMVSQIGKEDHPSVVTRTLGVSLLPYEGLFCRVIKGGSIRPGDPVGVIKCTG